MSNQELKASLLQKIEYCRGRSNWAKDRAEQIDYSARADALAEDYRELVGEDRQ